jgi:hypothetical protein
MPTVCIMDAGNEQVVILADCMLPPPKHGVMVPGASVACGQGPWRSTSTGWLSSLPAPEPIPQPLASSLPCREIPACCRPAAAKGLWPQDPAVPDASRRR